MFSAVGTTMNVSTSHPLLTDHGICVCTCSDLCSAGVHVACLMLLVTGWSDGDVSFQTGEGTPSVTGYLEVQIVGGKVLHSKKVGH